MIADTRSNTRAQLAAGMTACGNPRLAKAAPFHQRNRQRIAQRHHHRGRGGGRQPHRAGLCGIAGRTSMIVGGAGQRIVARAGDADQRNRRSGGYR